MNRKERQERYKTQLHELKGITYISYMPTEIDSAFGGWLKRFTRDIPNEELIDFLYGTSPNGDWSIDEVMDEVNSFEFVDNKLKVEDALIIEGAKNYCYRKLNEHGNLMVKSEANSWRNIFSNNNPIKGKEIGREVDPALLEAYMGLTYTYLNRVAEIHK